MNPAATPEPPDPGAAAHPTHVMTAEERAEYERLRRHAAVRHRRLRRAGSSVLLLMALLLAPLAVVAAWVQDTVSDTDRYVETVAPLASEPRRAGRRDQPAHRPRGGQRGCRRR
ncbi:hypothetical protein SGLAM104S_02516 [Streptomyces glaucescens]